MINVHPDVALIFTWIRRGASIWPFHITRLRRGSRPPQEHCYGGWIGRQARTGCFTRKREYFFNIGVNLVDGDTMGKKRQTVSDIKTALRANVRSKPKVRGSEFLEMFILEKNRARLEQEKENIEKKRGQIDKDIEFIDDELEELQERVSKTKNCNLKRVKQKHSKAPESMEAMTIEY